MSTKALKEIYVQYADMVYNLALSYVQNAEDAEEITQDVFVKVHLKLNEFEGKSSLKTWVYRITINQSLDFIKLRKSQKRSGTTLRIVNDEDEEFRMPGHFNHPGVELEHKEATEKIFEAINQLPDNQKTALILKSIEHLSQKEIAQTLQVSEKSVESLLLRARKSLKNLINFEGK